MDSTAVGIFTATLFDSAVTGFGYANSDGLHLPTTYAVQHGGLNPQPFMCMSHVALPPGVVSIPQAAAASMSSICQISL